MGLDKAGVEHDRSVKVGADLRTTNRRIYAIGDVAGGLQFTHVAGYHAGVIIRSMLFGSACQRPAPIISPGRPIPIRNWRRSG